MMIEVIIVEEFEEEEFEEKVATVNVGGEAEAASAEGVRYAQIGVDGGPLIENENRSGGSGRWHVMCASSSISPPARRTLDLDFGGRLVCNEGVQGTFVTAECTWKE